MASMQSWRKAYGAIKDTTTVSLANINSDFKVRRIPNPNPPDFPDLIRRSPIVCSSAEGLAASQEPRICAGLIGDFFRFVGSGCGDREGD
jgi:hypothetical protein